MSKKKLKLCNVVFWEAGRGDKTYVDAVQIGVERFPFTNRQVFLRFIGGPGIDLSVYDADRIVSAYLKIRGIEPPSELCTAAKPDKCDFSIPLNNEDWRRSAERLRKSNQQRPTNSD